MTHFNQLTPAQAERLAMLLEELGEAQQAVGKILRHGYESKHPNGGPTNRASLTREIGDVLVVVELLAHADDISHQEMTLAMTKKRERVNLYAHHQDSEE
jgi:NTP pyrophosphatase (non-canonical NTP hydrolase)